MTGAWGLVTELVGAFVGATTGFGGAAMLLPLLLAAFGPRNAIPILTVAPLIGNGSRLLLHRRAVDCRLVGWFSVGPVSAAILASLLLAAGKLW